MTLEEAIKHAEEIAEEQEGRGYCDRSVCVIMDENNHNCEECEVVKCRECAEEHRQLAEWLKELQSHREAWEKVEVEIDKRIFEPWENHICDDYFDGLCTAREIAKNLRPKEGENE